MEQKATCQMLLDLVQGAIINGREPIECSGLNALGNTYIILISLPIQAQTYSLEIDLAENCDTSALVIRTQTVPIVT